MEMLINLVLIAKVNSIKKKRLFRTDLADVITNGFEHKNNVPVLLVQCCQFNSMKSLSMLC